MSEQTSFPGFDETGDKPPKARAEKAARREPPPHSLFFAVTPGPDDLARLGPAADALLHRYGTTRSVVANTRLHVTASDLGGSESPLSDFRRRLSEDFSRVGVWNIGGGTAHMTLGYGGVDLVEDLAEPVRWHARDFVLIHSERCKTLHRVRARWALKAPG